MRNKYALIILIIANVISGIAQGISMIAIPWYFAVKSELALFAWVYIVVNLCSLFWVPYCGTLIDRYNRKNIFLVLTTVSGLILLAVAMTGFYYGDLPWYLVGGVFGFTFFNYSIHYPNLYAFVQEITENKYYGRIISYIEIQGQVAGVFAGGCAAILLEGTKDGILKIFGIGIDIGFNIEAWKIHEIFLLDACTYLVAFILIIMIRYTSVIEKNIDKEALWNRLKTGWRFLRKHHELLIFGIASYIIFFVVLLEGFYLGAGYVKDHLSAGGDVYAFSQICYSVGAIFAGVTIRYIFKNTAIPKAIITMTIIVAALYASLSLLNAVVVFLVVLLLQGITNAGTRILRVSYLYRNVPNELYGRTNSIFNVANIMLRMIFLALFSIPFFQHSGNIRFAFAILSVTLIIAALILIYHYKDFDKRSP